MISMAMFWLILLVIFLVAEAGTVALVSLWFAAGALAALVAALLGGGMLWQMGMFLLVSAGLLLALRPWAKRYLNPKITPTNVDSVIGSAGLVTSEVDNVKATGQVKLGAMEWTARSTSGDPIPAGTMVTVDRIEGVKVFVTPVKEAQTVKIP